MNECMYICMCIPNFPNFPQLTNHNNESKQYQFQNNTRLMLPLYPHHKLLSSKSLCVAMWKMKEYFGYVWISLSLSLTHTESSINVHKTLIQPLEANLRQQQKSMVSLLYNNHRRCNYSARSPYARLISHTHTHTYIYYRPTKMFVVHLETLSVFRT
jgi:hypothetical protein